MKELTTTYYFENSKETTLEELSDLANELLLTTWLIGGKEYNLKLRGWRFSWDTAKRSLGRCFPINRQIKLSHFLVRQNLNNPKELENTLRHEMAHAIDYMIRRKSNHDYHWKNIARQILCDAERCYTHDQIQVTEQTKYTLTCINCGKTYPSHKKKKRISACPTCCKEYNYGRYSLDYKLIQTQNY